MSDYIKNFKTILAKRFSLLYFFYRFLRTHMIVLLLFNFLTVMMDGLGITMFIPLLQVADSQGVESADNILTKGVFWLLNVIHVPVSIPAMLGLILLIFILKSLFNYYADIFQLVTLQNFMKDIRRSNAIGLRDLSYRMFASIDTGRLQNSLTGETNLVTNSVNYYLSTLKLTLTSAAYIAFAFLIDLRFSILVFIFGLMTNLLYRNFYNKVKNISRKITSNNHDYAGTIVQNISHFKYLKATGRASMFTARLLALLDVWVADNIRSGRLNALLNAMREPVMIFILCAVTALQMLVFKSPITAIVVILALFYRALNYILGIQLSWNNFLNYSGSLENMITFDRYLTENRDVFHGKQKTGALEELRLNGVSLSYNNQPAINNISLTVRRNENIAIVGESGSGKTTLANIICCLLHPDSGDYFINGISVDKADIDDFKSRTGYITQESAIFNADIFDNVTFWADRTKANIDRFMQVMDTCRLSRFIETLPKGYCEQLGFNGINLSGGQKQRITIARELFRNVELLIMDEATSSLDSETEKEIKDSLKLLQGKITLITIAHRLSTIRDANRIFLLNNGKITAEGSFDQLKLASESFRKMAELQGL
jgi:subfamily B ATP-binding cassette protein MsbA